VKKKASDERYGGIAGSTVLAKTGNPWREWFTILDKAGAKSSPTKKSPDSSLKSTA